MKKTMSTELKQCLGLISHAPQNSGLDPRILHRAYQLILEGGYGELPAQRMLERAAALNYGPACVDLAMLYYNGRYLNNNFEPVRDEEKVAHWLRQAANRGDPQACLLMARCYCVGIGVDVDERLAYRYISKISDEILRGFFTRDDYWDKPACLNEIKIIPTQILYLQTLTRGRTQK